MTSMTREEAIESVKSAFDAWEYNYDTGDDWSREHEARDMAIKALEQEPCDDAISRQAVEEITWEEPSYTDALNVLTEVRDKVRALPSVTPQPKMGHWIKYGIPRCGEQHYKCTSCGYYINFGQWGELYSKEFKYCPNCRAKMQEVEE